jgi:hypothetical protein
MCQQYNLGTEEIQGQSEDLKMVQKSFLLICNLKTLQSLLFQKCYSLIKSVNEVIQCHPNP